MAKGLFLLSFPARSTGRFSPRKTVARLFKRLHYARSQELVLRDPVFPLPPSDHPAKTATSLVTTRRDPLRERSESCQRIFADKQTAWPAPPFPPETVVRTLSLASPARS